MADFLDEKRREIRARLQELKPQVDEYHRLEAAIQALEGVKSPTSSATTSRARSTSKRSSGTGRRGRPRGSGTRGKQALELVRANPGITIPELATKMGIKQNYLYRVLPGLQKDGMVRKEGKGWHAREAA
jgi:predicted HTH transcriptional regulator